MHAKRNGFMVRIPLAQPCDACPGSSNLSYDDSAGPCCAQVEVL